jgi:phycobilisome core linker protein
MAAFIPGFSCSFSGRAVVPRSATCASVPTTPVMAYDMDGSGRGSLGALRIKSSGVQNDRRFFKVAYVLPSESRLYTFRELQNVYTVKRVPFSSWYAEQQRIQKMGGKILKVELASGGQMRSVS